jgi:hypothetical protein
MPDPALPRYALVDLVDRFERWDRSLDADAEYVKWSDVEIHLRAVEAAHQQELEQLNTTLQEMRHDSQRARAGERDREVTRQNNAGHADDEHADGCVDVRADTVGATDLQSRADLRPADHTETKRTQVAAEARLSALQEPQSIARFASGLQLDDED